MTTSVYRTTYRKAAISIPFESDEVYVPAEDSQLTADCACEAVCGTVAVLSDNSQASSVSGTSQDHSGSVKKQSPCLFDLKDEIRVLEIGCGSGFVSAVLSAEVRAFSEDPAHPERRRKKMILTACDISPAALEQTEKCVSGDTGIRPDHFRLIRSDLFSAFSPDDRFDLIIFNPPYLPTSEDEKVPGWLNYAFDGGLSGRDTIDRFLENAAAHLLPGGSVLLLISSITGPDEVSEKMSRCGLSSEIAGTVRCSFEELMVLRGHLL
ncbi:methyltransferase [Methanosarcinaceae archaeon]|nr:methyltransferase [Methanosarcinaceae archaeon]MBQ3620358.1 methyltransferase [Methanosarcinaceae archaeon]